MFILLVYLCSFYTNYLPVCVIRPHGGKRNSTCSSVLTSVCFVVVVIQVQIFLHLTNVELHASSLEYTKFSLLKDMLVEEK